MHHVRYPDGQVFGPYSTEDVSGFLHDGRIPAGSYVSVGDAWVPLETWAAASPPAPPPASLGAVVQPAQLGATQPTPLPSPGRKRQPIRVWWLVLLLWLLPPVWVVGQTLALSSAGAGFALGFWFVAGVSGLALLISKKRHMTPWELLASSWVFKGAVVLGALLLAGGVFHSVKGKAANAKLDALVAQMNSGTCPGDRLTDDERSRIGLVHQWGLDDLDWTCPPPPKPDQPGKKAYLKEDVVPLKTHVFRKLDGLKGLADQVVRLSGGPFSFYTKPEAEKACIAAALDEVAITGSGQFDEFTPPTEWVSVKVLSGECKGKTGYVFTKATISREQFEEVVTAAGVGGGKKVVERRKLKSVGGLTPHVFKTREAATIYRTFSGKPEGGRQHVKQLPADDVCNAGTAEVDVLFEPDPSPDAILVRPVDGSCKEREGYVAYEFLESK